MNLENKERRYSRKLVNEGGGGWYYDDVPCGYKFDDADRMEIAAEYLESGLPACKIAEKYEIQSRTTLFAWLDKFLSENEEMAEGKSKTASKDEANLESLLKENRRLKKALKIEQMRSDLFSTIIELAEAQFNIPIRKKFGTKQ